MTNDRALRPGRGRNVTMCKKFALGFIAATLICSSAVAQEVTLRAVTAFAEKTTYSRGFEKFIERVNAEGKGKIQINYIGGPRRRPERILAKAPAAHQAIIWRRPASKDDPGPTGWSGTPGSRPARRRDPRVPCR